MMKHGALLLLSCACCCVCALWRRGWRAHVEDGDAAARMSHRLACSYSERAYLAAPVGGRGSPCSQGRWCRTPSALAGKGAMGKKDGRAAWNLCV
jgi:hypothetical protein